MKTLRWLWIPAVLAVLAVAAWWWFGGHEHERLPSADDADVAKALGDPAVIARGKYLTVAGDCAACHTKQGGIAFAGGRILPTPFGNIPAPNITPDPQTGLGNWNFEDFWRALHTGVGRNGELLYPVFSYTSFTKVNSGDALAIYAYLRSLAPQHAPSVPLGLDFPYNVRSGLNAWRALYFKPGVFQADSSQSAEWNRGAYLVQGLGHCNECHVTRDALGGMKGDQTLAGGEIPAQNWYAPDLSTKANGGLEGWTAEDIVNLLKTGQSARGSAFGPMAETIYDSTQHLSQDDLQAIATYLQSLPARSKPKVEETKFDSKALADRGTGIYAQRCASCHGKNGEGVMGVYPPLNGNSSVVEPTGINATRVVLLGGFPPVTAGNPRPYSMPPFAQQLSDADVAAVVTYIRQAWSNQAGPVQERDVIKYRHTPID